MKDYQIVWGQGTKPDEATENLEEYVQKQLEFGWEPQGGVCVTKEKFFSDNWYKAFQAMIKNE